MQLKKKFELKNMKLKDNIKKLKKIQKEQNEQL